ncbi:MAG: hypothetical protein HZT41_15735 [Dechloromonas sp.]|nr:MAG: hypothetical protein HZT41_15735 [Dechloromonas sp.]
MEVAQVRKLLPNMRFSASTGGDGVRQVEVWEGPSLIMVLAGDQEMPINNTTRITHARVFDKRYATKEGVHPGMLLRDVEGIYGKVTSIGLSEPESLEFADFARGPAGITFEVSGGFSRIYTQDKEDKLRSFARAHMSIVFGLASTPNRHEPVSNFSSTICQISAW